MTPARDSGVRENGSKINEKRKKSVNEKIKKLKKEILRSAQRQQQHSHSSGLFHS